MSPAINALTPEDVERERAAMRKASRLIFRCKSPAPNTIADYSDCQILAVCDDGTEVELTLVDRVEILASASPDPVTAVLTFVGVEVDLDIDARNVETEPAPPGEDEEPAKGDEVHRGA